MISPLFWRLTVALTIKEIENAKPKAKKYKMLDGGGLSLLVFASRLARSASDLRRYTLGCP